MKKKTYEEAQLPHALDELWFKLREAAPYGLLVDNGGIKPEWEQDYRLLALTAGQGRLAAGEQIISMRAGSVYISPPGENLRAAADTAHRMEMYVFRFQVLADEDFSSRGAAIEPVPAVQSPRRRDPLSRCSSDVAVQDHLRQLEQP